MPTIRAKFTCVSKDPESVGARPGVTVTLQPVTCGSLENASFYRWTPGGQIQLGLASPETAERFELGKTYYVDFTPADA